MDFARQMGYRFQLQVDDDAIMNVKTNEDIVKLMTNQKYDFAFHARITIEDERASEGITEFTNDWIAETGFSPVGDYYNSLEPSKNNDQIKVWNRYSYFGYFVIINVRFWFREDVQSFVKRVVKSGKDIENRWQEQTVINIIRLLFVRENNILIRNFIDHNRHNPNNFIDWCVTTGIIVPQSNK
jgi:predicted lactoylglutathione lyase